MPKSKRPRSASVPANHFIHLGEGLDEGEFHPFSDLCHCCGRNWKKKNLSHLPIDKSSKPFHVGQFPIILERKKCPESEVLCTDCYFDNKSLFESENVIPPRSQESHPSDFIGDKTPETAWCQRVIVSWSLLASLIAFFVGALSTINHEVSYDFGFFEGVAILKLKLDGKHYEWTSSTFRTNPQNHRRVYTINVVLSNCIYLTGNRITALLRYLDLIGIWHQTKASIIARNGRQLLPAVKKYFERMMAKVKSILCVKGKELRPQEDEQHSRETRKRGGQAPYCTAVIIETITGLIMCRSHVEKKAHLGKALANISQLEVVKLLVTMVALTGAIITTFGVDGCTTALGVFTALILTHWPNAKLGRDNWHKMKEWESKFHAFCEQNTKKYAQDRLRPVICDLYNRGKIQCYKIKKHFIYCANNCNGNAETFREMFLGLADHYASKFDIPAAEVKDFKEFLASLLGKDLHLYVHGTHTSLCESFHSLCNKYCPKGCVQSFAMYCMLKDLAIIQWNENHFVTHCGMKGPKDQFRFEILNSILEQC